MNKYIPAVKIIDNHFKTETYDLHFMAKSCSTYQEALNTAADDAAQKRRDYKPVIRPDGFQFPSSTITPVVLKEVEIKEAT